MLTFPFRRKTPKILYKGDLRNSDKHHLTVLYLMSKTDNHTIDSTLAYLNNSKFGLC